MLPHDFLTEIAHEHELSPEQEAVFLLRLGKGQSYEEIATELRTSADACLKRMGQVYKKLNISGSSRGKENRLRIFLNNKLRQLEHPQKNLEKPSAKKNISNFAQVEVLESKFTPIPEQFRIFQNLPAREYTAFVGRDREVLRLMELLSPQHSAHLISVDGIGGVGKTTLAVEVAYRCFETSLDRGFVSDIPTFEAIIFTSAKQNHLTSIGLLPRLTQERTLREICREIARTLDISEISNLPLQEQIELIRQKLSQLKTLLIVDNLETIEDKQEVLSLLYDLPPTVKVIITTREQALFVPIRLGCLPREHGLRLIQHEAKEKDVAINTKESQELFDRVSGIPAAIIYAIGQMAAGYILEDVLAQIKDPEGDVARFCFSGSVNSLKNQPPHYLLMTLSLFVQPVTRETAAGVAFEQSDPIITNRGLAKLQQLSLVYQQQGRYGLLNLTREYALAELTTHREFAHKLRQRWVNWYVKFSEAYGGSNWKEWHLDYGYLETEWENLRSVLEWCMFQGRYTDFLAIWQHIKGYVHIRGYWDERLDWAAWLIEAAKQAGDWFTAVEAICDRASTLVRIRQKSQLEEGEMLLQEAWNLRHHQTIKFQLDLAANMAILYIQQEKLQQAKEWLSIEQELLQQASLSDLESQEQQVHILYYQGRISYQSGNYQESKILFQKALEQAKKVGWQRATAAMHNWLADIALILGNLKEARELLELSLPMAQRHKDKRSIAFHKATFAKLEKITGNLTQAKRFAKEAAEGFESLKMITEAKEMQSLLSS